MDEQKFMELVRELMEAGFTQQEAIEEARKRLSQDMAVGGRAGFNTGGFGSFKDFIESTGDS